MRAVAADREGAEMLGINVNFTITATFFIGSALAGVAGVMGGLLFQQVTAPIGFIAGLKAFTAAVVGGIGALPRAVLRRPLVSGARTFLTRHHPSAITTPVPLAVVVHA